MGEEVDPLPEPSLQEGQDKRERGLDVVPAVVHELPEEIHLLTAGLQLDQLTQPGRPHRVREERHRET